jgi:LEA14-like dessication related protein
MVLRKIAAGLIALVVVIAGAFAVGILGVPSGGVEDVGDWGKAEEEQTEIVTTLWVDNPNPIGVNLTINMNGVPVAEGNKTGVSVGSGNNTIELRTFLQNEQLQPWWVTYVRNNETIHVTADGEATIDAGVGDADVPFPNVEETMLADQTPIITSLSESAAAAEGDYTRTVAACAH